MKQTISQKASALAAVVGVVALVVTAFTAGFAVGRATIQPRFQIFHPRQVGVDWTHVSGFQNGTEVRDLLNKERPTPDDLFITISSGGGYHLWYRPDHSDYTYTVDTLPVDDRHPGSVMNDPDVIFGGVGTSSGKEVYVFFHPEKK